MGATMVEKILAAHCGKEQVRPGEIINVKADLVVGGEVAINYAIEEFDRSGFKKVFDNEKIAYVTDHMAPNRGIDEAEVCKAVREFARRFDIKNYFELGRGGVSHAIVPEKGLVGAGDVVIGADSHTCTYGALGAFSTGVGSVDALCAMVLGELWLKVPGTIKIVYNGKLPQGIGGKDLILYTIGKIGIDGARYKSIEYTGEALKDVPMDGRFTMANMSIEAGAKCGLFEPDEKTIQYLDERCKHPYTIYRADKDAEYDQIIEFDVSALEPQVAMPHLPENAVPVSEAGKNGKIYLDQVFIGSCCGGLFTDLQIAAEILKGRKVNERLRLIVIPASQEIYHRALKAGFIETLIEAGAAIGTPCCGPCGGRNYGVLASGEKCATTSNRNFKGRMGHKDSELYLVGPAVAAASAALGYIASPREVK